jgi:hypothetical protein
LGLLVFVVLGFAVVKLCLKRGEEGEDGFLTLGRKREDLLMFLGW